MTKNCVEPKCNSNCLIKSDKVGGKWVRTPYVTVFNFPSDIEMRNKWLDNLPNAKGSIPIKK